MLRSVVVIPARLASTRLPRKLLLRDTGRTVLEHTWANARRASRPQDVWIAADDEEIVREARAFGAQVALTSPTHQSGTDRIAELANLLSQYDVFVNVQGDEPDLPPEAIDQVVELLERHPLAGMATMAIPIRSRERLENPACVKVVMDQRGRALYFSRSPIPHPREWRDDLLTADPPLFWQHVGLYAYRREFLMQLVAHQPTRLEQTEKLEQLRVLDHGGTILVGQADFETRGIDTPEDYQAFVASRTHRRAA